MFVFEKAKSFDLCIGKCQNGHMHIFGFPQQLDGAVDHVAMTMTTTGICRTCGLNVTRIDKLQYAPGYVHSGEGI